MESHNPSDSSMVSNIYNEVITFWFDNKNYWFGCPLEFDALITSKYKNLLDLQTYLNLDFYLNLSHRQLLGKIILLDQFSRHIYRDNSNKIKIFDNISVQLLNHYNVENENFIQQFSNEERCFLIMPYRHTFDENYLMKCIKLINIWKIENYYPIYRRFYQATLKALIKVNNTKDIIYRNRKNIQVSSINSVIDEKSMFDLSKLIIMNDLSNNKLYREFAKNLQNVSKIYVSISGGVDSMVCLYLLYIYAINNPSLNLEIGAISINYNNRHEQHIELFMVSEFCKLLRINYYSREITEITRTRDSDRELYESITREIRFDAYKKMNCPIILGHNNDDCLENIFINLKNKAKYNNLFGMEIKSCERDVTILRPLLHVDKKDIVQFAQQHNIPYIYDSTCRWSNRGKLRDNLMPSINNFDTSILPNLVTFVKNYNEIYKIYEKSIDKIDYYDNYCIIDHSSNTMFFEYFKKIFNIICVKYNVKFVKNKAIEYLIECMEKDFKNRITLSKNLIAQKIGSNIKVFIK
jgi:tRNA(Ile)-lysidine synthetase-like protein